MQHLNILIIASPWGYIWLHLARIILFSFKQLNKYTCETESTKHNMYTFDNPVVFIGCIKAHPV